MQKKVHILIENELLAQIYKTNFIVYLGAEIVWFNSAEQSLKDLEKNSYDLLIIQTYLNNDSVFYDYYKLLKENKIQTPTIMVGDIPLKHELIFHLTESLNIQLLLNTSSKLLGITAQMMADKEMPEYYPMDITFFLYLKRAPTQLFLMIDNDYMLFANKDILVIDTLKNLKKEGVKYIYVKSIERLEVVKKITEILKDGLIQSHQLSTVQKTEILATGFDFFVNNFVSQEAAQELVHTANVCSRVMNDVVGDSPDMLSLFNMFRNNKDNYIYIHTMLTVYVCTHILRNVDWGGENQIDKMNFVLFFHDIPLVPLYVKYPFIQGEEGLLKLEELTKSERHTVLNHARISAEMVATLKKCPIGSDQLIKQHHGMGTGIGFAEEFKDDISPMAKIIIVAEAFIDEFIQLKEHHPKDPINMVEIIQKLNDKFKKNSYKKIVETLLRLKI